MTGRRGWQHAGQTEAVDSDTMRRADERFEAEVAEALRRHEHYWLALVGYVVTPPLAEWAVLDHENIRVPPSLGCFICEQPYAGQEGTRCTGNP